MMISSDHNIFYETASINAVNAVLYEKNGYFPSLLTIFEDEMLDVEAAEMENLINFLMLKRKQILKEKKFKVHYEGSRLQTIYETWKHKCFPKK